MKNTIVTAIYFSSPLSRMGGRGYTFEHYVAPFRNLINLNSNIVVFSHDSEINKIHDFFKKYNFTEYKIINFDLNTYYNSNKIYEIKEKEGLINENGLVNGVSYIANDRNHHLCLLKLYFLKYTIDNNLFNTDNYYWVDAGLFHHGIFPETYGGIEKLTKVNENKYWPLLEKSICNPTLFERLENKNKSEMVFIGIDGYYPATSWFINFSTSNKLTHIIGGLFGGKKDNVLELCDDFNELANKILNSNILTLEEEVLSILYTIKYNKYSYIPFNCWYHDIPSDPNYFGIEPHVNSFYKIFI